MKLIEKIHDEVDPPWLEESNTRTISTKLMNEIVHILWLYDRKVNQLNQQIDGENNERK